MCGTITFILTLIMTDLLHMKHVIIQKLLGHSVTINITPDWAV